jgi:hypothetical protein
MSSLRPSHARSAKGPRRPPRGEPPWAQLPDDELLEWRICDLGVRIEGTVLADRIGRLHKELESRAIRFRPHYWLGEDWFSPEGVPGIAIPFYIAHPRLARLERTQMLEVEGGTRDGCMRILRHEVGHAIDTAFGLHRLRRWQAVFGKSSMPYPDQYAPKPYSKSFVRHLDNWYAQSHPDEDFAETFAVWLKPRSNWRSHYEGWPALRKLELVDALLAEIRDRRPRVVSRERIDPVDRIRKTLRTYYAEKRARYGVDASFSCDRELRRLFSDAPEHARRPSASAFLRRHRQQLLRVVAEWTGQYKYTVDQVLREMIERCVELRLRVHRAERRTERDAQGMLTVQTMNYLHRGHHKIAL